MHDTDEVDCEKRREDAFEYTVNGLYESCTWYAAAHPTYERYEPEWRMYDIEWRR